MIDSEQMLAWLEQHRDSDGEIRLKLAEVERSGNAPLLVEAGLALWRNGRSYLAVGAFDHAFGLGYRETPFLVDYVGLLTGEMKYDRLRAVCEQSAESLTPGLKSYTDMLLGHASLAEQHPREQTIESARRRETSNDWLSLEGVIQHIHASIADRRPFSLVRVGDGEAKALVYHRRRFIADLAEDRARAIGDNIWHNWFGRSVADMAGYDLDRIMTAYLGAVENSTILGLVDAARLYSDTGHYGYLAFQDDHLARLRSGGLTTDSMIHYQLNRQDPYLRQLVGHCRVSFVSPHKELAVRFSMMSGQPPGLSVVVPGERRLQQHEQVLADNHYPEVFDAACVTLSEKSEGEVFLVAAGLLGKIYCEVIRSAGGIAIDIGSIADGWMGYNTRPGHLDDTVALPAAVPGRQLIG